MVRVLQVADGFLAKIWQRERTSAKQLWKYAHIRLMSCCQDIDASAKGLNLIKNLSPSIAKLPVSSSTTVDVVVMNARVPCDLAMSQDKKLRPIVNGYSHLGQLILADSHNLSNGGVKQTISSRGSYWVTQGSRVCRGIIRSCLDCTIQRGKAMSQRMAPLSAERTKP